MTSIANINFYEIQQAVSGLISAQVRNSDNILPLRPENIETSENTDVNTAPVNNASVNQGNPDDADFDANQTEQGAFDAADVEESNAYKAEMKIEGVQNDKKLVEELKKTQDELKFSDQKDAEEKSPEYLAKVIEKYEKDREEREMVERRSNSSGIIGMFAVADVGLDTMLQKGPRETPMGNVPERTLDNLPPMMS